MLKNKNHLTEDQIGKILKYDMSAEESVEYFSHWVECKDCRDKIWDKREINVLCAARANNIRRIYSKRLELKIPIKVFCTDYGVINIKIIKDNDGPVFLRRKPKPSMPEYFNYVHTSLENYLSGDNNTRFTKIDPSLINSDFQREILFWTSLIPYSQTVSYKQLGEWIDNQGYQAIGNALNSNPLPIIIPCHRVIKEGNKLGGYVGGENVKKELLQLEGAL